ncbi:MAG TPA: ferrous iron transporter B, partial [Lachnoclostridium sp.]|nr:ferrous iron transporter B [Lachnoclostridium sp.]
GAVLGFVPQMLVLFLLLAILEDIGYMARVAFVMDRIFRQFGLSGKSFIPCLVATGCGVPGVMASRTIENERDRRMTVMTTTFMPCGAKLPIIGLIAGAVFGGSPLIAASAYFIGIGSIILSGIILKKFKAFAGEPAPFVMELPPYHVPSVVGVLRATWERGWSFIKRAGSVIVISSIIIWFLSSFGTVNGRFGMVDNLFEDETVVTEEYITDLAARMDVPEEDVTPMDASLLAGVGSAVAPVFKPLGFGSWKPTVATVTGLVAKEEVVGTFGVLYNYDGHAEQAVDEETGEPLFDENGEPVMAELSEEGEEIWDRVAADYTPMAAFAFMVFNLLCAPCFAAIGAIKREMNNTKWTLAAVGYMTLWAYVLAFIAYNLGGVAAGEFGFGIGSAIAVVLLGVLVWLLVRKGYQPDDSVQNLTAVNANT